jgi:hypothetical protein
MRAADCEHVLVSTRVRVRTSAMASATVRTHDRMHDGFAPEICLVKRIQSSMKLYPNFIINRPIEMGDTHVFTIFR